MFLKYDLKGEQIGYVKVVRDGSIKHVDSSLKQYGGLGLHYELGQELPLQFNYEKENGQGVRYNQTFDFNIMFYNASDGSDGGQAEGAYSMKPYLNYSFQQQYSQL